MWSSKKKDKKPSVVYDQAALDAALADQWDRQRETMLNMAKASLEYEEKELAKRYKLLKDRKKTFAVKMVDAIARGTVEQLLKEWEDPCADGWE